MKTVKMKGKNVEDATEAALAVLGVTKDKVKVNVISEGKPGILGVIGGEEAEVEVSHIESVSEEAIQILQNILDKMGFLAVAEHAGDEPGAVNLAVKGEDMGRIIGKEGAMLKALDIITGSILWKLTGERVRVNVDAGGYREKRIGTLQRLSKDIAAEVLETGEEKVLPWMSASDRRIIHIFLQENDKVTTFSRGEGGDRRLVVAPKQ